MSHPSTEKVPLAEAQWRKITDHAKRCPEAKVGTDGIVRCLHITRSGEAYQRLYGRFARCSRYSYCREHPDCGCGCRERLDLSLPTVREE